MTAVALPVRQNTPEWLEARRNAIGSSDIPVITGNRSGLMNLWAVKAGLVEPEPLDAATQDMFDLGHLLEDDLAEMYVQRMRAAGIERPIARVNQLRRHPAVEWAVASLDRRSARKGERRIIELKWAPHRRWSEGPETVPASVQDQLQWQFFVMGYDVADVGVLEGSRFAIHEVGRDDGYIDDLVYLARHFLELVRTGTRPAVDGSGDAHRTLGRLYPREERDVVRLFGVHETWDELAAQYRAAEAAERAARARLSAVKAAVKALLAEAAGVESEPGGYRFLWKATRRIDWPAIAAELEVPADLVAAHTHTDWKAVVETLRPQRQLIDAHARATGPRRLTTRFRGAPPTDDAQAGDEEEASE